MKEMNGNARVGGWVNANPKTMTLASKGERAGQTNQVQWKLSVWGMVAQVHYCIPVFLHATELFFRNKLEDKNWKENSVATLSNPPSTDQCDDRQPSSCTTGLSLLCLWLYACGPTLICNRQEVEGTEGVRGAKFGSNWDKSCTCTVIPTQELTPVLSRWGPLLLCPFICAPLSHFLMEHEWSADKVSIFPPSKCASPNFIPFLSTLPTHARFITHHYYS